MMRPTICCAMEIADIARHSLFRKRSSQRLKLQNIYPPKQKCCMREKRPMSTMTEWWQPYVADYGCEKPSMLSQVLAETFPVEPPTKRLLDIGCGTGIIGLYCLLEKKAGSVTFVDVMHEWID